jgi:hypothetical protein
MGLRPFKSDLFLPLLLSNVTDDVERLSAFELFVYKDTVLSDLHIQSLGYSSYILWY